MSANVGLRVYHPGQSHDLPIVRSKLPGARLEGGSKQATAEDQETEQPQEKNPAPGEESPDEQKASSSCQKAPEKWQRRG